MPRLSRDTRLETRQARSRLKPRHEPYWRQIDQGFYIGYRKGMQSGVWLARLLVRKRYVKKRLGNADDYRDDNGVDVLSYSSAQEAAREWSKQVAYDRTGIPQGPYTVADAVDDYLGWYEANRKAFYQVRCVCERYILPKLGDRVVSELTSREIRSWHQTLAKQPAKCRSTKGKKAKLRQQQDPRARQATANRVLTVLKAALNYAWREGLVASDDAWRRVRPFRNVEKPRIRYLNELECRRLINACAPDFRKLVQGALYTGCRYGELIRMRCEDFIASTGVVTITESKSGKVRYVPLTEEGQIFFSQVKADRKGSEWLFKRHDGNPWGACHQVRLMREASRHAKIEPAATFHVLRHTYGSMLAMRGVSLQVIAEVLGHADTRITNKHYAHLLPSYIADTIRANAPNYSATELDNVVNM